MCSQAATLKEEEDEKLASWDPRQEDYLGEWRTRPGYPFPLPHTRGAGPGRDGGHRPRGLYISNLPGTMTAESVRRLFGEHGVVESVVMGRPGPDASQPRWAIVNPHSTRDAVAMLGALHGRPPLCLKVTPATTPEEKQQQQQERQAQQHFLEELRRDLKAASAENSTPVATTSSDGPANTNTLASAVTTTDTTTSHNEVSEVPFEMGHGVVVVDHRPALPCVSCGAAGQLVCAGCGAWYCRRLCQAAHWPLHSTNCSMVPGSVSPSLREYWGTSG
ncbi:uncharacterized protein LOC123512181 isoform X2 [Portunus trituberculatus]|nr:uncharacterized protein LOC123512181 isoform X2 [Portunus trituberculatus]XP_045124371.1 uncharacterized protein LOC123512181 isoform X2 [Portunus trituberculatus]